MRFQSVRPIHGFCVLLHMQLLPMSVHAEEHTGAQPGPTRFPGEEVGTGMKEGLHTPQTFLSVEFYKENAVCS